MASRRQGGASRVVTFFSVAQFLRLRSISSALVCLALALAALGLSGCRAAPPAVTTPRIFHLEGTVVSVDKPKQQLVVNHKEIPGLMAAMTMGYPVAVEESRMLDQLGPGDQITAELVVDSKGARLRNIVVVKKGDGATPSGTARSGTAPATAAATALRQSSPANPVNTLSHTNAVAPDFALLNQDGHQISLQQYRGKALLLTFIYTRCPLPDQCPLMTHNFAVIEKALAKTPGLYARTHLLSISFDPQYDTPAILRNYARGFGQDRFDHWEFASLPVAETRDVARFFDIFINEQQGQINHSTATAIIEPDGSLYRLYSGNEWKPETVLADLASLLSTAAPERNEAAIH
jgi:protein SCO1